MSVFTYFSLEITLVSQPHWYRDTKQRQQWGQRSTSIKEITCLFGHWKECCFNISPVNTCNLHFISRFLNPLLLTHRSKKSQNNLPCFILNVPHLLPPPFITTSPGSPCRWAEMVFWFLPHCCFSLITADLQTELSQPGPRSLEKVSNLINSLTDDLFMIPKEQGRYKKLDLRKRIKVC